MKRLAHSFLKKQTYSEQHFAFQFGRITHWVKVLQTFERVAQWAKVLQHNWKVACRNPTCQSAGLRKPNLVTMLLVNFGSKSELNAVNKISLVRLFSQ